MLVCSGAMCQCIFGAAPTPLSATPGKMVDSCKLPAMTILDNQPIVNVPSFGMCTNPANPAVVAATAAAFGVPTPAPCVPVTSSAPWTPGSTKVIIKGVPALNMTSTLMCQWGGVISITNPGQPKAQVT